MPPHTSRTLRLPAYGTIAPNNEVWVTFERDLDLEYEEPLVWTSSQTGRGIDTKVLRTLERTRVRLVNDSTVPLNYILILLPRFVTELLSGRGSGLASILVQRFFRGGRSK